MIFEKKVKENSRVRTKYVLATNGFELLMLVMQFTNYSCGCRISKDLRVAMCKQRKNGTHTDILGSNKLNKSSNKDNKRAEILHGF